MNKYTIKSIKVRTVCTSLMIAAVAAPISARKTSVDLKNSESSGLNALDYVLQKPLGNPTFPEGEKGTGKHLFFGVNAGGSLIGNTLTGDRKPGGNIGLRFGGWITPIHGFRIGADGGIHSVYRGTDNAWFGSFRADYLLNLSALLHGYNPYRRFELIGAAGLKLQRLRQNQEWGMNYGASASLQMRFNVAPSLYMYIEPEVAMLAGHHYDQTNPWYRMSTEFTLNLGLGYRILSGRYRRDGSTKFYQSDDDNLYFGAGAGLFSYAQGGASIKNPIARGFIGKMFSSTSGLQIDMNFGQHRPQEAWERNKYVTIGSLDYVLNLNNACGGYRPREIFQMILNAGVSAGVVTHSNKHQVAPGVQFGVTGLFRLSSNWGIYIHPQVYTFSSRFNEALGRANRPIGTIDVGLRYTIGDYSRLHHDSYQEYESAKHWFLNGGLGASMRLRGDRSKGGNIYIGFGKRFTPVSSWRINWEGNTATNYTATSLHFDYLSSITTAMLGYNPDRVFDLQLVAGIFAGAAKYLTPIQRTYGLTGGLQANFRLNSHLDLYLEPQVLANYGPMKGGNNHWYPEARLQVGLRYKLGSAPGVSGNITETPYGDKRNFVGAAIGAEAINCKVNRDKSNYAPCFDLTIGRWFSTVSGARAMLSNDFYKSGKVNKYVASGHIDYLLNITSLMDHNPARRIHILGIIGAGLAKSSATNSSIGGMLYGGAQLRYNLPANIDLHFEPAVEAWDNKTVANTSTRFALMARMTLGASYRF